MKNSNVIVKTTIVIDGVEHQMIDQSFTKSVSEAIDLGIIDNIPREIIEFVFDNEPYLIPPA